MTSEKVLRIWCYYCCWIWKY